MPTCMCLITILADHILALFPQAYVVKCSDFISLLLFLLVCKLVSTEPTLFRILEASEFVAIFTGVIWRHVASMTVNSLTLTASDPEFAHMNGCSG